MTTAAYAGELREALRGFLARYMGEDPSRSSSTLRQAHVESLVQELLELRDDDLADHLELTADWIVARHGLDEYDGLETLWHVHDAPVPGSRRDPADSRSWVKRNMESPTS